MPYNLAPSSASYPFKIIYFICTGVLEQPASETLVHNVVTISQLCHDDTIITSHKQDKQCQSLADVNVSSPKARVRSHDCSMFCIEKCKHLEY